MNQFPSQTKRDWSHKPDPEWNNFGDMVYRHPSGKLTTIKSEGCESFGYFAGCKFTGLFNGKRKWAYGTMWPSPAHEAENLAVYVRGQGDDAHPIDLAEVAK